MVAWVLPGGVRWPCVSSRARCICVYLAWQCDCDFRVRVPPFLWRVYAGVFPVDRDVRDCYAGSWAERFG